LFYPLDLLGLACFDLFDPLDLLGLACFDLFYPLDLLGLACDKTVHIYLNVHLTKYYHFESVVDLERGILEVCPAPPKICITNVIQQLIYKNASNGSVQQRR
jgi:hypothetical protein